VPEDRSLEVAVVTPEGAAWEGRALAVVVPAYDGEMAFFPMHAPLVGVLGHGELRITALDGTTHYFYLSGGVVQIADDRLAVLAESVVPAHRVDPDEARRRLADALAAEARGDLEISLRLGRMEDARARLRVAERVRLRQQPTAKEKLAEPLA
jgi:F-type H+-transporting ATPase subunit epsilon